MRARGRLQAIAEYPRPGPGQFIYLGMSGISARMVEHGLSDRQGDKNSGEPAFERKEGRENSILVSYAPVIRRICSVLLGDFQCIMRSLVSSHPW